MQGAASAALIAEIEPVAGACADKNFRITMVAGNLVDRGETGAATDRHDLGVFRWQYRNTVGPTHIGLNPGLKLYQLLGKFSQVNHHQ